MTMTTYMRFLEPVDPRLVWAAATELIAAPERPAYQFSKTRRGELRWSVGDDVALNDMWRGVPGQGAYAWLEMMMGHEGALLINEGWQTNDRAAAGSDEDLSWVPPAYLELSFDTAYGFRGEPWGNCGVLHDWIWTKLTERFGHVIAWYRGECCNGWHENL